MLQNWVYAFASSIGSGHIMEQLPCQDSCKVADYGAFGIFVVSDGAGSCSNSHIGSQLTTDSCLFHFKKAIDTYKWDNNHLPAIDKWNKTAKETLYSVKEDLEKYSLSHEVEFKSLACTVIVVIAFKSSLLVVHIGDGRAGYCNFNSEWHPIIKPFHGELANQTVFITSDIWDDEIIDSYIESSIVENDVKAFCLLTDGCEKASFECNLYNEEKEIFYDPNKPFPLFFNPNVAGLIELYNDGKTQKEINELWENFLSEGNERLRMETDDKTMILAVMMS